MTPSREWWDDPDDNPPIPGRRVILYDPRMIRGRDLGKCLTGEIEAIPVVLSPGSTLRDALAQFAIDPDAVLEELPTVAVSK